MTYPTKTMSKTFSGYKPLPRREMPQSELDFEFPTEEKVEAYVDNIRILKRFFTGITDCPEPIQVGPQEILVYGKVEMQGMLAVFNFNTGKNISQKLIDYPVFKVLYIRSQRVIISTGTTVNVIFWRLTKKYEIMRLSYLKAPREVFCMELSSLNVLITCGSYTRICFWNINNRRLVSTINTRDEIVDKIKYIPSYNYLVYSCARKFQYVVVCCVSRRTVAVLNPMGEYIASSVIEYDYFQDVLYTGGYDGEVRCWNIRYLSILNRKPESELVKSVHKLFLKFGVRDKASCIYTKLHPDWLVVCGLDRTINFMNLKSRHNNRTLHVFKGKGHSFFFTKQLGKIVASDYVAGEIVILGVPRKVCIDCFKENLERVKNCNVM